MITYDVGMGVIENHGTKLRVLPVEWFYPQQ